MKSRYLLACLIALGSFPLCLADEAAEARKVVDRAIHAAGGAKLLDESKVLSGTSRGNVTIGGQNIPATNSWSGQDLDKLKWSTQAEVNNQMINLVIVLNGKKGWIQGNNNTSNPLQAELLTPFRHAVTVLRLVETLTPLQGREYTLSSLGEIKVDDEPAVGVKVKRKGLPDLDLYFNKKTNLPIKADMRLTDSGKMEIGYTAYFRDYKKVTGRMVFTRLTVERDGKTAIEMQRENIKATKSAAEGTFDQP